MAGGETVLVTGGSGYIGGWCVASLLQRGYVVRATVRDLAKEAATRAAVASVVDPGNRLSFHAVTLTADDGWDAAMDGCDYVLHVASPLGVAEPKDPDVLIKPAREGARRAVSAAIKAGVKRVVQTSSVAATSKGDLGPDWKADETASAVDGVALHATDALPVENNLATRWVAFGADVGNEFCHFISTQRFDFAVGLREHFQELRVLDLFLKFRAGRSALLHHILLTFRIAIETELTVLQCGLPIWLQRQNGVL